MYGNGYSMAIVLDHRFTATSYTGSRLFVVPKLLIALIIAGTGWVDCQYQRTWASRLIIMSCLQLFPKVQGGQGLSGPPEEDSEGIR